MKAALLATRQRRLPYLRPLILSFSLWEKRPFACGGSRRSSGLGGDSAARSVCAVALVSIIAALGCRGREAPCARAQRLGETAPIVAICTAEFQRTHDPEPGLAALRALGAGSDQAAAHALSSQLTGTAAESAALVVLAEMSVRLRDPQAAAQLGSTMDQLLRGHHLGEAAAVARLQGKLGWAQSQYQEALAGFDRSVQLAEQAGDLALKTKALLGAFTMLLELGDLRGARQALQEATRGAASVDPDTRRFIAFDRGLLAAAEEQPQQAAAAFAEVLHAPGGKPTSELSWNSSLNLLALALDSADLPAAGAAMQSVEKIFTQGEYHDRPSSRIARSLYAARLERLRGQPARALDLLAGVQADKPSLQWAWQLALERGRALSALKQPQAAGAALEESAQAVEALRGDQFDDFKSWVLAERRAPFLALFEMHAERGDAAAALQILERVQGRTFIEAFAAKALPAGAGPSSAPRRVEWLRRLYPALRASPVLGAAPLSFAELSARLRDVQGLAFFEGKDHLYAITMHAGQPRVLTAPAPLATIRQLVAGLEAAPDDVALADQLGAALLPAGALPSGRRGNRDAPLFIVPCALLARLPFAALRQNGRYLVQDHVLAQIPSFNGLAVLRQPTRVAGRPPARPALILANAALDLPEAEGEAHAVAKRLGAGRAAPRLYVGADAVTDRLREAQGASVLHLALHSGVGVTGPWLGLHDRHVLAGEILDWRIAADLVVLASCASAATPDPGLWGSLVTSFLASGSPAVVGSLWSTRDQVSRQLVENFYDQGGAHDPALALARAQRAWLLQKRPVGDWAAFAFYGAPAGAAARKPATKTD